MSTGEQGEALRSDHDLRSWPYSEAIGRQFWGNMRPLATLATRQMKRALSAG